MIQNVVEEVVALGAVARIGALQIAEAEEAQILQQLCVPLSPALTNGTGLEDEFADDVLALPNARILIHQPAMEGMHGQASDIEIVANEIDRMRAWLEDTLATHTGQPREKVHADLERDTILTAQAAKDYGLVDQVLASRKAPRSPHSA